jgi:hypothetical protein
MVESLRRGSGVRSKLDSNIRVDDYRAVRTRLFSPARAWAVNTPWMSVKIYVDQTEPLSVEIMRFRRLVHEAQGNWPARYYEKPSVKRRRRRRKAARVRQICQRLGRHRVERMIESEWEIIFF